MAIKTDSYIEVKDSNDNVLDRIGLSKTLDKYSIEDLINYGYCSNTDKLVCDIETGTYAGSDVTGVGFTQMNGGIPCLWSHISNPNYWMLRTEKVENPQQNNVNGLYGMIIWLYGDNPSNSNPAYTALAGLKLVTEWDAPHYLFDVNNASFYNTGAFGATNWTTPKSNAAWAIAGNTSVITYHTDFTSESDVSYNLPSSDGGKIKPYLLFKVDASIYIKSLLPIGNSENTSWKTAFTQFNSAANATCSLIYKDSDGLNGIGVNNALLDMYSDAAMETLIPFPYKVRADNNGTNYGHDINGFKYTYLRQGTASPSRSVYISYFYSDVEDMKLYIANAGLHFKADKIYKPIINSGHVDGFTDVLTTPSELDDWHDTTNHGISPTPTPQPTPSGDDMDIMNTGATGSSGGFTHFYVMSPQNLIDLLADFYDHATSGETISNNLVCSYILGIPSKSFCATESVPVAIHNSAQGTPFVSKANYSHITATNNLLTIGSFDVPRMTNTFYDFAPYTTYEVFVPCCGWISLPDTVAGRTINVELYLDIASCCVKAGVKINGKGVCAVSNGVLGAAIPMAVIESGILRGNNIQAGLGIIGGGINTGIGAGTGNAYGIGVGVQQILSGLVDCTIAGNTNYTQQKGGTGDITQFAMGHECYMKITHPDIDPVVNNAIFGHSVGYLCNSIGKLSGYAGFTVCGNPHVTFSASAEEREEIERLLSMGVIL